MENRLSISCSATKNSFDIFEKDNCWSALPDSFCDEWEQVSGVICCFTLSRRGEGLTREASREDVHASSKLSVREGFNVREHRCCIQFSRFHLCNQVRDRESFPLHVSEFSQIWENSSDSKPNAFVSATKAEVCNCFGSIHIVSFLILLQGSFVSASRFLRRAWRCQCPTSSPLVSIPGDGVPWYRNQ